MRLVVIVALPFDVLWRQVESSISSAQFEEAEKHLVTVLSLYPDKVDALQLYGTLIVRRGDAEVGVKYLQRAVELGGWSNAVTVANYIQALRRCSRKDDAAAAALRALKLFPDNVQLLTNAASLFEEMGDTVYAAELYEQVIRKAPDNEAAYITASSFYNQIGQPRNAEIAIRMALERLPQNDRLYLNLGYSLHHQNRVAEALEAYVQAYEKGGSDHVLAAIASAYQQIGDLDEAMKYYERIRDAFWDDPVYLNNYGSLLTNHRREEEGVALLKRAISLDPALVNAYANIGTYYAEEGNVETAKEYFLKATTISPSQRLLGTVHQGRNSLLRLRSAIILSPVSRSWLNMSNERATIMREVQNYIDESGPEPSEVLDASLDRTVFYISYHGFNDRQLQELIVRAYEKNIVGLSSYAAHAQPSLKALSTAVNGNKLMGIPRRRFRIGFVSRYFGIFEPHALLLDGIMRYLPRSQFEVFAFPIFRQDGKPVAPGIVEGADRVIELSMVHTEAVEVISSFLLDAVVFADTQSEPTTHFMCHHRMAAIQIVFWGNPLTSASKSVDYFISADDMEHPFRTRVVHEEEPYSEQVVLLDGQGIWYYHPDSPQLQIPEGNKYSGLKSKVFTRAELGYQDDWFILLCPQSVFKIHPEYDFVFRDILAVAGPHAHIVVTGGRKDSWTARYVARLQESLGAELSARLHVLPRISSEKFLDLLKISDVLLHPFPFDGSRTSADGIGVGIPVLTLPSEHLRGRMGASFYRTMNIPEMVAKNRSHYVAIAAELSRNKTFYAATRSRVAETAYLVWEDMEQPYVWAKFLSTLTSSKSLTWEAFIKESGRDAEKETRLRDIRTANRARFRAEWGEETWLIAADGTAPLPSMPTNHAPPTIFSDWSVSNTTHAKRSQEETRSGSPSASSAAPRDSVTVTVPTPPLGDKSALHSTTGSRDVLDIARELIREKGVDAALDSLRAQMNSRGNDQDYLVTLGSLEYMTGDYVSAATHCRKAVESNSRLVAAHTCLGLAAAYLKQEELAVTSLVHARAELLLRRSLSANDAAPDVNGGLFLTNEQSLNFNLLNTLFRFQRVNECLDLVEQFMDIPPMGAGGANLLMFSLFNWSAPGSFEMLTEAESRLRRDGVLELPPDSSLISEIRRIQSNHLYLIPGSLNCVLATPPSSEERIYWKQAENNIWRIIRSLEATTSRPVRIRKGSNDLEKFALVTQYYQVSAESEKSSTTDLESALARNLANPLIGAIILFCDKEYNFSSYGSDSDKILQVVHENRLTFDVAFKVSSDLLNPGSKVIIGNIMQITFNFIL
jgi:protein O-GlcNAc transferase